MLNRLLLSLGSATLVLGLSGALTGCSVLIDVDDEQCRTNADCEALGPSFAGATCEANVCALKPNAEGEPLVCETHEPSTEERVRYSFAPIYLSGSEPEDPTFSITACNPADLDCEKPVDGPRDVTAGEPQDFLVPPGFQGYFQVKNADMLDALVFLGRPIWQDTVGWNITMPTRSLVAQLSAATREEVDPELGIIIAVARDCDAKPIAHVKFENSKAGLQYYFVNNFPDTSLDETKEQGAVGFANVPISTTTLTATLPSGQELRKAIIRVKPRTVSLVELFP
jgi:hypothetical protein